MKCRMLDLISALMLVVLATDTGFAQQDDGDDADGDDADAAAESASQSESTTPADGDEDRPPIYPWLAAGLIDRGVPVIDVRSQQEVEATRLLGGAENIPHTEIDAIADFIGEPPGRTVILYCSSGRRTGHAIEALSERGYQGLVNAGGYEDLQAAMQERAADDE